MVGLNIPRGVVASTNAKFLYTAVTTAGQILVSAIDPKTGALSTLQTVAFANAYERAVDPLGRYLFATNNAGTVQMYVISSSGTLTASTGATSGSPNVMVAVDSQGRYVYAGNSATAILDGFTLQSNGTLSATNSFGTGGFRTDFIATAGNYLYVADLPASLVRSYSLGATSTPASLLGTGSTTTVVNYLAVHPSLLAVYSLHSGSNSIYVLPIGANGLASGASAINTGIAVNAIAIDSTGRFAYVVGGTSTLLIYQINSNGSLSLIGTMATSTTPIRVGIASFSW